MRKWCSELTCLTSQRQKGQGSTHLTSPNHINPFDYILHRGLLSRISLLSPRGLCTVKERNTFSCDPNTPKKVEACQTFTSLPLPRLSLCPPAPVAPSPQSTLIRKTHNKQMLYISEQEKSTSFVFQLHFKDTGQKQQSFSKMWNRHPTHPTS